MGVSVGPYSRLLGVGGFVDQRSLRTFLVGKEEGESG